MTAPLALTLNVNLAGRTLSLDGNGAKLTATNPLLTPAPTLGPDADTIVTAAARSGILVATGTAPNGSGITAGQPYRTYAILTAGPATTATNTSQYLLTTVGANTGIVRTLSMLLRDNVLDHISQPATRTVSAVEWLGVLRYTCDMVAGLCYGVHVYSVTSVAKG